MAHFSARCPLGRVAACCVVAPGKLGISFKRKDILYIFAKPLVATGTRNTDPSPVAGTFGRDPSLVTTPEQPFRAGLIAALLGLARNYPKHGSLGDSERLNRNMVHPLDPFLTRPRNVKVLAVFEVEPGVHVGRGPEYEIHRKVR
jgi:hypothetical protein